MRANTSNAYDLVIDGESYLSAATQTVPDPRRQAGRAMTRRSIREDHADRRDGQIPDRDPTARPRASGAVELARIGGVSFQTLDAAVEMPVPWKSQNDFHRTLEISHRTRDSHIPTADSVLRRRKDKHQRPNKTK